MVNVSIIDPTDFKNPVPVKVIVEDSLNIVAKEIYDELIINGVILISYEEFLGSCLCAELEHLAVVAGYMKVLNMRVKEEMMNKVKKEK